VVQFFLFILILCGAVWGSALVFALVGRLSRRVESGNQDELLVMLREELDVLSGRLGRVEEELEFYKRLQAPKDETSSLTDGGGKPSGADEPETEPE
jgi:hypothetical protein